MVNDCIAVNVNEVTNNDIKPEDFKSNEKNQENEKDKYSDSDKDVKPSLILTHQNPIQEVYVYQRFIHQFYSRLSTL